MGATMGKSGGTILDSLPSTQGTLHIVMLGLDSAGKTTALYRLKFDQYLNTVPTIGFNCEKVRGSVGKAKGVQFLVWDVGGQEKLRPLWRSYTRCTDGIVFVVDSIDVERMEEAKMELMRTAKCPDNQGVPVLILANKQDLPGAGDPKELEKLLGLHELSPLYSTSILQSNASSNRSTNNKLNAITTNPTIITTISSTTTTTTTATTSTASTTATSIIVAASPSASASSSSSSSSSSAAATTITTGSSNSTITSSTSSQSSHHPSNSNSYDTHISLSISMSQQFNNTHSSQQFKGWYIQPACAITGEGLQEGLEALYDMIIKKRKLNKVHKRKR